MRPWRSWQRPSLVAGGFILGVAVTAGVSTAGAAGDSDGIYRKLEVLAQLIAQIEGHYVDAVSPTDLVYGAAKGAVGVLDEHSAFFTPEEYRELVDATEGEYAGIGVELDWDKEVPHVVTVVEGSAAQRAGIQPGDRLMAIDGAPVTSLNLEAVQQRLRGPVGSKVLLTLRRRGRDDDWTFTLVRAWLRVAPLESKRIEGDVLSVRVKTFSRRVASDLGAVLARERGIKGLVLDLRGNPGGLFDEAVAMADLFLRDGPIVTAVGRGGRVLEHYDARSEGHEPDYPIAVLIDHGTASAAEVVAGSLSDRGRARLFGVTSYGKGSVQSVLDLADGSGLKLTVARYYTPSGRQIDQHGIAPDETITPVEGTDVGLQTAAGWIRSH
jgi:carboxyl-terminal processing protease